MIVVKHKIYIYLIKKLNNGKLQTIALKTVNTNEVYGAISNNCEYLVYWEKSKKRYEVYKIID